MKTAKKVMTAEEANRRIARYFRRREKEKKEQAEWEETMTLKGCNYHHNLEDAIFFNELKMACKQSLEGLYEKYPDIKAKVDRIKAEKAAIA